MVAQVAPFKPKLMLITWTPRSTSPAIAAPIPTIVDGEPAITRLHDGQAPVTPTELLWVAPMIPETWLP
jgi:hypothetical protein